MAQPDDLPAWATDDEYAASDKPWSETANKVEPPAAMQAKGFEPRRRPPAPYFNWLFNVIYQWLLWLQGVHAAKWKWVNSGGFTGLNQWVASIDNIALVGTAGQFAQFNVAVDLPEGAKLLKLAIVMRHVVGEPAYVLGQSIGSCNLYQVPPVADGIGGSPTPVLVKADPDDVDFPGVNTISIQANGAAGALWETYEVDLDQTDMVDLDDANAWGINVTISGALWVGAVGYQYRIDS